MPTQCVVVAYARHGLEVRRVELRCLEPSGHDGAHRVQLPDGRTQWVSR